MASPFPLHEQAKIDVAMAPGEAFARLDDHRRLAAHMASSSPMMAGASMHVESDDRHGQAVGSRIRLSGRVLGIALEVEEAVTEYEPPRRKVWQTLGEPRLLVIGPYRTGFEVQPNPGGSASRCGSTTRCRAAASRAGSLGCLVACTPVGAQRG